MRVLSLDCGVRNLAYCVFDTVGSKIDRWEAVDLVAGAGIPQSGPRLVELVVDAVISRPWLLTCDRVVIERQPSRNPKMICVQHALASTFIAARRWGQGTCESTDVTLANARRRWSGCAAVVRGKRGYGNRKSASVRAARTWLHEHAFGTPELAHFEASPKRDDLADCLMQCLLAVPNQSESARILLHRDAAPAMAPKGIPRPRAPTAKQTASGKLSAANVVHAFVVGANMDPARFEDLLNRSPPLSAASKKFFPDAGTDLGRAFSQARVEANATHLPSGPNKPKKPKKPKQSKSCRSNAVV